MANRKEEAKIIKLQQKVAKKQQKEKAYTTSTTDTSHNARGPSYASGIPDIKQIEATSSTKAGGPPPNPMMAGAKGPGSGPPPNPVAAAGGPPPNPMMSGGPGAPPPNPVAGGTGGPPPNPMMGGGPGGGPPPAPVVKKRLTGAEMAALSRQNAEASGVYKASTATSRQSAAKPPPMVPVASSALLAGIRGGMNLRKTTQIKREPKMDQRDTLLAALRGKGRSGLKKVKEEDKNVKAEEKVDNTIFAILNRRQYMADDSDSDSASTWSDDSD